MKNVFKLYFINLLRKSAEKNIQVIMNLLDKNDNCTFLDLGCDDGKITLDFAKKIGTEKIYGVEIVDKSIEIARANNIKVLKVNLNEKMPFDDSFFDVITANQIIEHLYDTDNFVSEIKRILKPGGIAIISTENLASWHNVFSLFFGFQPFSITNYSNKGTIGNPLSLWKKNKYNNDTISWQHQKIFSYFGLRDLFKKYAFEIINIKTSGYYPFFSFLSNIDKVHGHWLTIKIKK